MVRLQTLFLTALAALALPCLPAHANQVSADKKMIWLHAMITFPLDLDVVKPWVPEG